MPEDLLAAKELIKQRVFMPLFLLLGIHMVMLVLPTGLGRPLHLMTTLLYFGALGTALWHLRMETPGYLDRLYTWRYRDADPLLRHAVQLFLQSAHEVIDGATLVLLPFIGVTAARVLSQWAPSELESGIGPLLAALWWLSFLSIPVMMIFNDGSFATLLNRHRFLSEETRLRGIDVNAVSDVAPFEVTGENAFRAAGNDWNWEGLRQNMVVLGMVGSGKTACVLNVMLDGLLSSAARGEFTPSALIFDAKGDYLDKIGRLCRRLNRGSDLRIIDPDDVVHSERWNPLDNDEDPFEVASWFGAVLDMLGMAKAGDDTFWIEAAKNFFQHAINLLRHTSDDGSPASFRKIMRLAADKAELAAGVDRITTEAQMQALEDTLDYFANIWIPMPDRTQTSVQAQLQNMLGPFLGEPYDTLFGTSSTLKFGDVLDEGRILYIHMPTARRGAMARIISTFIKLEFQQAVRRRLRKPRYSLFFCDEFQEYITAGADHSDDGFFALSRESNHVNIIATQSLQTIYRRVNKPEAVKSMLGNCGVKVFLRNTDPDTTNYAAEQIGKAPRRKAGETRNAGGRARDLMRGGGGQTTTTDFEFKTPPETFAELTIPTLHGEPVARSIVHFGNLSEAGDRRLTWPIHRI